MQAELDRHEDEHAEIAGGGNDPDDPGCERRNHLVKHRERV